jgi:folylpolyglutamate synthase/dihydrofolate synthase
MAEMTFKMDDVLLRLKREEDSKPKERRLRSRQSLERIVDPESKGTPKQIETFLKRLRVYKSRHYPYMVDAHRSYPRSQTIHLPEPQPKRKNMKLSLYLKPLPNQSEPPSIVQGLDNIKALLSACGNPQKKLSVVHVAGTNGKGSTCAYLSSVLYLSGFHVGRFVSPHLIDRWDCITLNGKPIPKSKFLDLEDEINDLCQQHSINASSFERLTAIALLHFANEKVSIAVIEVGMGGLLDATNVFNTPLVSIITPISLDHTTLLGSTIEEITKHKAGIIKKGCPVVIGEQTLSAYSFLKGTAKYLSAPIYEASGSWTSPSKFRCIVHNVHFREEELDFVRRKAPYENFEITVTPGIAGNEQVGNVSMAVTALSILRKTFPCITEETVIKGVAMANMPGRCEWIHWSLPQGRMTMLLDGAHNVASCSALSEHISSLRRNKPVTWIIGFSSGRDIAQNLRALVRKGDNVACVEFGDVDGMEWVTPVSASLVARDAKVLVGRDGVVAEIVSLDQAIKWGISKAKESGGMLVCTGSLYLVGEVYRLRREKRDDPDFDLSFRSEED